jgi:soluble lytic murein transglycosylase-like protein
MSEVKLVKHRHIGLAIAAVCSSHGLLARGVQVQSFQGDSVPGVPFVLTAVQSGSAGTTIKVDAQPLYSERLATDFSAFGDAAKPAIAGPPSASTAEPAQSWDTGRHEVRLAQSRPPAGTTLGLYQMCDATPYRPNPALRASVERRRLIWYGAMADAACAAGVPITLFDGMIVQESGYNPMALSPKGAASLAQLMPGTARRLGVSNVWDPADNLRGGARYLRTLLDEFGRYDLALAAYNAGENRVRSNLQVPRIKETILYVSSILTSMRDEIARKACAAC